VRFPGPVKRVGAFAGGAFRIVRRRREGRAPRVRVRLDHGEATVLPDGSEERERLLALAHELVGEYEGSGGRGG
jgi:hypothetical protein